MDFFKLEPGLAIWTWISFGILFFILAKFVIPAILKNLQEREDYIHSSVDKTAQIEQRLEEIDHERSAILEKAGEQADQLLLKVRQDAEELRRKLVSQAEAEAEKVLEQAHQQIEAEQKELIASMRQELAQFVCNASEKVTGMAFIGEREQEYTRELVKTL